MNDYKQSYSINEFCTLNDISRALFYILTKEGKAPRLMKVGRRTLISTEAAADWRSRMEELTANGGDHPAMSHREAA